MILNSQINPTSHRKAILVNHEKVVLYDNLIELWLIIIIVEIARFW